MSSRALRKAQKQREEAETLKRLQEEAEESEESEDEGTTAAPTKSAFELLGEQDDDDDDDDEQDVPETENEIATHERETSDVPAAAIKPSSNKRKKRKKKAKASNETPKHEDDRDDIDAALEQLKVSSKSDVAATTHSAIVSDNDSAFKVLAVESANLHAENEMRRLFGRAAVDSNDRDEQAGARRRNRGQQMAGLAAALGRRQGQQGGRTNGLGLLGMRRNLFIQGKEEWPVGTSGGLGMEIVEKRADGSIEYRFVHNTTYQSVQGDFDVCVRSMDPERMVHLLQMNPYHISTLLQVSEIAKQERDHSTSGDLLERALFTFGRSLHSTFATSLAQGKARLDFRRPENREFWLAVSRYITNLSMRATWRTVFEWAKLLLSLDPEHDPYSLHLVIDQYAIRARQPQQLVDLANNETVGKGWKMLPNIQFSLGLALVQAGQASKGKQVLFNAVNKAPWVVARLYQELNIDATPGIWGKTPRTDWEKLCSELYAIRAKDLWNTPEAQNLLIEVSSAVVEGTSEPPIPERSISINEGRHVLLSDKPEVIALLPRSITAKLTSASDPLPPPDSILSYVTPVGNTRRSQQRAVPFENLGEAEVREMQTLFDSLGGLMPAMAARLGRGNAGDEEEDGNADPAPTDADLEAALERSGMSMQDFETRIRRFTQLYQGFSGRHNDDDGSDQVEVGDEEEQ